MIFVETPLPGAYLVTPEAIEDDRGVFARTWCEREFAERRLDTHVSQCSVSCNRRRGTLRGLHYQVAPHAEAKLVRCTRGCVYDVIVDLRTEAPTYLHHHAVTLSADDRTMLYVPTGFAHGFQTLADDTDVQYQISTPYVPDAARGIRWDDPALGISWPQPPTVISERDRSFPDVVPAAGSTSRSGEPRFS